VTDLTAMPLKRPPPRHELTGTLSFGKYVLPERVPCGDDDECYVAVLTGMAGFSHHLFLRRFHAERLDATAVRQLRALVHDAV
jgi:hypothetical protein